MTITERCPLHANSLPGDGTPLAPSPQLAAWREEGGFAPLAFQDGHEGFIATRYEAAVSVLQDARFSMRPRRMPVGPGSSDEEGAGHATSAVPLEALDGLDEAGKRSEEFDLLTLDGDQHSRLRRAVAARFSLRQARALEPWIRATVARQIDHLREIGPVVDLWRDYAMPISARTHCHMIGIPERHHDTFVALFAEESTMQQKYDFIRALLDERRDDPGEDVITDVLAGEELERVEVESLLRVLMSSGHDSAAYLIATASVALLTHVEQLAILRDDPERIHAALEELMRVGAMFVTLFPRTATEDIVIDGLRIPQGASVSVSPVAANRDPRRWGAAADEVDVSRDAFGHLGFGHGIHGCMGQQVARIEIREALVGLIRAFPDLALVHADQSEPRPFPHPVAVYEAGAVIARLVPDR